jgi:hypothetical protein
MKLLVGVYLAAIVAANWSVTEFGPQAAIYNAFLLIGLDLVARDRLHDAWAGRGLWPRMAALIAAGSALSYLLGSSGRIAVASCLAFAAAATLDAVVYQASRRLPWLERSNLSNVAGAGADSIVFQSVAFGWAFPFIFAQFTAKVSGALLFSLILNRRQAVAA